jgi:hypothetical protein
MTDKTVDNILPLHVKAGEIKAIPARTYNFSQVNIEAGGVLQVEPNSRQWLIIHCTGDFQLHGKIVFRDFYSSRQEITAQAPDGRQLSFKFEMTSLGGDGAVGSYKGVTNRGGLGARGTTEYGGGGGGAGTNGQLGAKPGTDASGYSGGNVGGGKGGRRNPTGNGGLLYLRVIGEFDGTGGEFDLSGKDGEAGGPGHPGNSGAMGIGTAGGGGGAPGGDGGYLGLAIASIVGLEPAYKVRGGLGGPPGTGTRGSMPGETGLTGIVDYIS